MTEEVAERVHLLAGEESWKPCMQKYIDLSILPRHMHGNTTLSLAGLCEGAIRSNSSQ